LPIVIISRHNPRGLWKGKSHFPKGGVRQNLQFRFV
jgi:hypothetical protein